MRHGSLFSGIGGFDLAAEWMGWENVFHCENNSFCQKILKHYWPDAKSYEDITTTDFTEWNGKVDIISGGFPCQPYSQAGKRKGKADDRHLWPQMLRAIREIQPRWVVGENVPGLLNWERGMVLDEIKADLEAAGFEVFPPLVLPAAGVNAPHRRDRLWIVAHNNIGSRPEYKLQTRGNVLKEWADIPHEFTSHSLLSNGKEIQTEKGNAIVRPKFISNSQAWGNGRWNDWPNQHPIYRGNDGIPNRMDRIKALGNAIVPQIAYEIFKAINEINDTL